MRLMIELLGFHQQFLRFPFLLLPPQRSEGAEDSKDEFKESRK